MAYGESNGHESRACKGKVVRAQSRKQP